MMCIKQGQGVLFGTKGIRCDSNTGVVLETLSPSAFWFCAPPTQNPVRLLAVSPSIWSPMSSAANRQTCPNSAGRFRLLLLVLKTILIDTVSYFCLFPWKPSRGLCTFGDVTIH